MIIVLNSATKPIRPWRVLNDLPQPLLQRNGDVDLRLSGQPDC